MRNLWMLLLLAATSYGQSGKPYAGVNVEIRQTYVVYDTLRIEAVGTHPPFARFSLECSANKRSCPAPKVGKIYVLLKPQAVSDTCDNYTLGRDLGTPVCLTQVEKD
jgi:hypothetical protein